MTPFAFVFPGQGSQIRRHARRLGRPPGRPRRRCDEASAALGEDIGRLIREGPKEQLDLTTNTQPVMLTAGIACYRAWLRRRRRRRRPSVAGHSLGEYTRAGRRRRADARRRAAAGALSRRRRCRRRCRSAPARWPRSSASTPRPCVAGCARPRARQRRGRRGRQLQRSEADRDRRQQGRRRQGLRAAQGRGRQAGAAAGGVGAVPFAA